MGDLTSYIQKYYGDIQKYLGDSPDYVPIGICFIIFILLVLLLRSLFGGGSKKKFPEGPAFDATGRIRGRLERVEKTLNEFRTEVLRSLTISKGEIENVRRELAEIKILLSAGIPETALQAPERATKTSLRSLVSSPSESSSDSGQSQEPSPPSTEPVKETASSTVKGIATLPSRDTADFPSMASASAADLERLSVSSRDTLVIEPITAMAVTGRGPTDSTAKQEGGAVLSSRLQKTRKGILDKIKKVFETKPKLDQGMLENLEAHLVFADLGIKTVSPLMDELKESIAEGRKITERSLKELLKSRVIDILSDGVREGPPIIPVRKNDGPMVVLMVGVNGSGKTTTVAKLAASWKSQGLKVMMVAADTFRAAAVEQLRHWGKELDLPVVFGEGEVKPSTVVFDSMEKARKEDIDVLIIDTAGRLHTKSNLMQELEGISNVIKKHQPDAPHETLLVVDGSTGQNAVNQAREFHAAVPLTGLIVTKLDGTPKGGVVVAIKGDVGIPVKYIGVGEGRSDLRPFDVTEFVNALFDTSDS